MQNRFEDQLLEALDGEVGSEDCGSHLTRRELRRLARGRTRASDLERQGGHLACCAECRTRYDDVRRELGERRGWEWVRVVYRHAGVGALTLSIVALVLVLGPRGESVDPSTMAAVGTASPTVGARGTAPAAQATTLDAATLARELHALDGYPPHRAAAYAIGVMARYGIDLSSPALRFRLAGDYYAQAGDTWETVAAKTLGDSALWPVVLLMNLELTADGAFVPVGQFLRVPSPIAAEEGP